MNNDNDKSKSLAAVIEPTPRPSLSMAPRSGNLLAIVLAVTAVGISVVAAMYTQEKQTDFQLGIWNGMRDVQISADRSKDASTGSAAAIKDLKEDLAKLNQRVLETQGQEAALKSLYEQMARGQDDMALSEIDHLLHLATEQLKLAGNVRYAITALQIAEERLIRLQQGEFEPLRVAIRKDLDTLPRIPNNTGVLAARLEQLTKRIDPLPLAGDYVRSRDGTTPAGATTLPWWERVWAQFRDDTKDLIRIRRVDRREGMLLTPEQSYFLKENLKLRLLSGRIALLQQDRESFHHDLDNAQAQIKAYFDVKSPATSGVLQELQAVQQAAKTPAPSLDASLGAVRLLKAAREKAVSR